MAAYAKAYTKAYSKTYGAGGDVRTWQLMSGETSKTLTVTNVQAGDYGRRFRCVVSNAAGSATSNSVEIVAP